MDEFDQSLATFEPHNPAQTTLPRSTILAATDPLARAVEVRGR